MSIRIAALFAAACCALLSSTAAHAQDTPATDYNKRLKIWQTVSPAGETPFGEQINLYTGELSFSQTDFSFPGTGPEFGVTRFTVTSLEDVSQEPLPFGNWDMAIPRIQTLIAPTMGWKTMPSPGVQTDARCTYFGTAWSGSATGITLITDSGESQPVLKRHAFNTQKPVILNDVGQTMAVPIVTNANWQIGCLTSAATGGNGEGFMAVSPQGVRYWLTHLVTSKVEMIVERDNDATIRTFRDLARMYVTKIQDRFGNTVNFTWNGKQLTRIQASDGRRVDFTWRTDVPVISSVTMYAADATPRTWQYQYYVYTQELFFGEIQKANLTAVVLPDGSKWQYSGNVGVAYDAPSDANLNQCTTRNATPLLPSSTVYTGTIVSPTGLTGTFEAKRTWHGRSYVVSACDDFGGGTLTEGVPPIFGAIALTKRTISGPGVPSQSWVYAYSAAQGSTDDDACFAAGNCPETASVDVTDPEGNKTRSTYSTRWGVGEGRLIKTETFQGASTLIRTEAMTYATPTQGAWPDQIGISLNAVLTSQG